MIPFVEVSHLPSSASFYSAVLQPLGLRCIPKAKSDDLVLLSSVTYGFNERDTVLQVRQSEHPLKPPRLSSFLISASERSAVLKFHACGLKADPPSWSVFRNSRGLEKVYKDRAQALQGPWTSNQGGVPTTRAVVYDLDGNRLEVTWSSDSGWNKSRVLEWYHDSAIECLRSQQVVRRSYGAQYSPLMAPPNHNPPHYGSRRSSQVAPARSLSYSQEAASAVQEPTAYQQGSLAGGVNTTTVVGALLGAAAGAALTYGFVSSSRDSTQSPEPEARRVPALPRRATFPEKPMTVHEYPPRRTSKDRGPFHDYSTPRKVNFPDLKSLPIRGAYVGADDDVEYGVDPSPPPRYVLQEPPGQKRTRSRPPSSTRVVEEIGGPSRQHVSQVTVTRKPSTGSRSRSEAPRERRPFVPLDDEDRRSLAQPRRSVAPKSTVSRPPLSRSHRANLESDRESNVSSKSHRSSATLRNPEKDRRRSEGGSVARGRPSSHVSASTVREPPRESRGRRPSQVSAVPVREHSREPRSRPPSHVSAVPLREHSREPRGRPPSHASARRVPLPASVAGSSHAHWDPWDVPLPMSGVGSSHANWDDDMVSLAPSDSISCAGSKSSRRHKRRAR